MILYILSQNLILTNQTMKLSNISHMIYAFGIIILLFSITLISCCEEEGFIFGRLLQERRERKKQKMAVQSNAGDLEDYLDEVEQKMALNKELEEKIDNILEVRDLIYENIANVDEQIQNENSEIAGSNIIMEDRQNTLAVIQNDNQMSREALSKL
jgi:hypothetical protein